MDYHAKNTRSAALAIAANLAIAVPLLAYDTFGNGYGSKWGADPNFGGGAVITWGYMLDGATLDPEGFPFHDAIQGTSDVTTLRNSVDVNYGVGSFDAAIQNAFNTWAAVANITFVGPLIDSGAPVGAEGAIAPHIRIGAFNAVPGSWFRTAIGLGPPGPWGSDYFPLSGDIIFNVAGTGTIHPYQIAPGTEDVDPVDVFQYGDDVEGLFVHELGHALGLEHPRWAGENPDQRIMYTGDFTREDDPFCCLSINRQLHEDDIAGVQAIYGIRGDYNRDNTVDAADYILWRKLAGQPATPGTSADGNIDGLIDDADRLAWQTNYGNAALTGFGEQQSMWDPAAVPEPSMLPMPLLGALFAAGRDRRPRIARAME